MKLNEKDKLKEKIIQIEVGLMTFRRAGMNEVSVEYVQEIIKEIKETL